MYPEVLSVEQAARRLAVHPKTLLRHIRSGRLRATRIGKAYRITGDDLDAFAGMERHAEAQRPAVTTVVDLPDCTAESSAALTNALHARLTSRGSDELPIRLETAYSPERRILKLIVIGGLEDTIALLSSLRRLTTSDAPA